MVALLDAPFVAVASATGVPVPEIKVRREPLLDSNESLAAGVAVALSPYRLERKEMS